MKIRHGIFVAACLMALTGCSQRTVVGTWAGDGLGGRQELTLTKDGKFTYKMTPMGAELVIDGDYVLTKESRLELTNLKLDAGAANPFLGGAQSRLPQMMRMDLAWKTDDEIVLTASGPALLTPAGAFKRQK